MLFPEPTETEFRADFDRAGRRLRTEIWLGLLVVVTLLAVAQVQAFVHVDDDIAGWSALLASLVVPMLLRWLSTSLSPVQRWSAFFYITAVFLDVAILMAIRVIVLRNGVDTVPLVVPTAILASLIVVQIRFVVLAPATLAGLSIIVGAQLALLPVDSNTMFDLVGCAILTLVPLVLSHQLEHTVRDTWRQQRQLARLHVTDPLTGLPNRRELQSRLTEMLDRPGHPVAVAILDADDFKSVNDTYGHPTGDAYLRDLATYLDAAIDPESEFVARLAGEEFIVVFTDDGTASRRAEISARVAALRAGITELQLPHPGGGAVTASAGCALFDRADMPGHPTPADLIGSADRALYDAKAAGRNRVRLVSVSSAQRDPAAGLVDEVERIKPLPLRCGPLGMAFPEPYERRFRETFDAAARPLRRRIMVATFAVCLLLLAFGEPILQLPEDARVIGPLTLILGVMPAALLAAVATLVPRLQSRSTWFYIGAIAIIIVAQMTQRVMMVPLGHETVPFLMPTAILLSMGVVLIRFDLLLPAMSLIALGFLATELAALPPTTGRLISVVFAAGMVATTLRFAYRIEQTRRLDWEHAARLHRLVRTDPLTGLPNRRHWREVLTEQLNSPTGTALLIIDVDHFKAYNDRYGHLAGDTCLKLVGQDMRRAAGPEAFVSRLGGEEFAVILSGHDVPRLAQRAQQIRRSIDARTLPGGRPGSTVTLSAGLAVSTAATGTGEPTFTGLVERADQALYAAKDTGRDRLVVSP